jgi:hypothetical protein
VIKNHKITLKSQAERQLRVNPAMIINHGRTEEAIVMGATGIHSAGAGSDSRPVSFIRPIGLTRITLWYKNFDTQEHLGNTSSDILHRLAVKSTMITDSTQHPISMATERDLIESGATTRVNSHTGDRRQSHLDVEKSQRAEDGRLPIPSSGYHRLGVSFERLSVMGSDASHQMIESFEISALRSFDLYSFAKKLFGLKTGSSKAIIGES